MELRQLRYFVNVAERLSFTKAAEILGVAQPALSQQIRRLEEDLDVRLFERTRRSVRLTDAGRALLAEAIHLLEQATRARQAAQHSSQGNITAIRFGFVRSAPYSAVTAIIRAIASTYPHIDISMHDLPSASQMRALHDEEIDCGVLRTTRNRALAMSEVVKDPLYLVVPDSHRLAKQPSVRLLDARNEPFVVITRGGREAYYDELVVRCRAVGFTPRIVREASESRHALGLVAAGIGVALLTRTISLLEPVGVRFIPLRPAASLGFSLAWRANAPPILAALMKKAAADAPTA